MSAYYPKIPPNDVSQIPQFLMQELSNINQAMSEPTAFYLLEMLTSPPTKIRQGMIVLADGVRWNPGAGSGVYAYYGGSWNKLG